MIQFEVVCPLHLSGQVTDSLFQVFKNNFPPDHTIMCLSDRRLKVRFKSLLASNNVLIIASSIDAPVGFVLGRTSDHAFSRRGWELRDLAIIAIRRPRSLLKKALHNVSSNFAVGAYRNVPWAEHCRLSLIVVERDYGRIGIGQKMLNLFDEKIMACAQLGYGLTVRKSNVLARAFYEKNGFKMIRELNGDQLELAKCLVES